MQLFALNGYPEYSDNDINKMFGDKKAG